MVSYQCCFCSSPLSHSNSRYLSYLWDLFSPQNPFYVRCIKPNEIKSPVSINDERVSHQVREEDNKNPAPVSFLIIKSCILIIGLYC